MKIANGIEMLEITMNFMGNKTLIHPTLLWDEEAVILVDTGMPGQFDQIQNAMEKAGVPFSKLNKVILTHQDIDHIGGMPEIQKKLSQQVEVYAHDLDRPYIQGEKPLIKMNPERIAKMLQSLPDEQRSQAEAMFSSIPTSNVDHSISDGDVLPFLGGITVIFTPGHTPGHVSLYLNESKVLITGDALGAADGKLIGPNPQVTPDMDLAIQSLKKLTNYDIDTVICYHGGICRDNIRKQLEELANQ